MQDVMRHIPTVVLGALTVALCVFVVIRDRQAQQHYVTTVRELGMLSEQISRVETTMGTQFASAEREINRIEEELRLTRDASVSLGDRLSDTERQTERQLERISESVTTLERRVETDPRLLQKYSKVFFLNEHYEPERLVEIDKKYSYSDTKVHRFHARAWPYLKRMIDEAAEDNIKLWVVSGYRSFAEQTNIKSKYAVTYGAGTANTFSAEQGYSEHQLGTAVDFTTEGLNGGIAGFDKTEAYQWLLKNAHRFGFILSYPPNNAYYIFEPWHWRFVGVSLATDLYKNKKYFYDLEQREIDKYLVELF